MKAFQINPDDQSVHQVDYTHADYTSVLAAVRCDILNFTLLDSENVLYHGLLNTINLDQAPLLLDAPDGYPLRSRLHPHQRPRLDRDPR